MYVLSTLIIFSTFTIQSSYVQVTSLNRLELGVFRNDSQSKQLDLVKKSDENGPLSKLFPIQEKRTKSPIMSRAQMNITSSGKFFEGYNLIALMEYNSQINHKARTILITDMEGNIFAELEDYARPTELFNITTVICGKKVIEEDVNVALWNLRTNNVQIFDFVGHHDFEYNPINNTFFILKKYTTNINGISHQYDLIEEYDLTGQLVWSLNTASFITPAMQCPYQDFARGGSVDVTHTNTVFFDVEENVLYVNPRNINTFYKIDHRTGEVIWGLGEHGNFTLFDVDGRQTGALFYHSHAVEKVDDNTFILFDNDLHNQLNAKNKQSRIVEIIINEETMTANESWIWVASPSYWTYAAGDADRLPNGNRFGTFGTSNHPPYDDIGARLVEVNDTGQIVWEMNFPKVGNYTYWVTHTDRLRFKPIIETPDLRYIEGNLIATWQTWYNFRTKMQITEPYTIFLDDQVIQSGFHTFDKFWRPTNLTVNLGNLDIGNHDLRVVFNQAEGYLTTDSTIFGPTSSKADNQSIIGFDPRLILGNLLVFSLIVLVYKKQRISYLN